MMMVWIRERSEGRSNSRHILKAELIGFIDGLDVGQERAESRMTQFLLSFNEFTIKRRRQQTHVNKDTAINAIKNLNLAHGLKMSE